MSKSTIKQELVNRLSEKFRSINNDLFSGVKNDPKNTSFVDFINFSFYGIVPSGSFTDLGIDEKDYVYSFSVKNAVKNTLKLNSDAKLPLGISQASDDGKDLKLNISFNNVNAGYELNFLDVSRMTSIINDKLSKFINHRKGLLPAECNKYKTIDDFYDAVIKDYNKGLENSERIGHKSSPIARENFVNMFHNPLIEGIRDLGTELEKSYLATKSVADVVKQQEDIAKHAEAKRLKEIKKAENQKEKEVALSRLGSGLLQVANRKIEENTLVSFALVGENGQWYGYETKMSLADIKFKYDLSYAQRFLIMEVVDKNNNAKPLDSTIVDICPNATSIEIGANVTQINNNAFARKNINSVFLVADESFDSNGNLVWKLEEDAFKSDNSKLKVYVSGHKGKNNVYTGYTPDLFMQQYYNNELQNSIAGRVSRSKYVSTSNKNTISVPVESNNVVDEKQEKENYPVVAWKNYPVVVWNNNIINNIAIDEINRERQEAYEKETEVTLFLLSAVKNNNGKVTNVPSTAVGDPITGTISEIKKKYSEHLNKADGVLIMGVFDKKDNTPGPLTKDIVDLCPNASTIEVSPNVSQISKEAFSRDSISDVFLMGGENFDSETGKLAWDIEQGAVGNGNSDFRIHLAGARRGVEGGVYTGFTAESFNNFYENYNGLLKADVNGGILTTSKESVVPKTDNNEKVVTKIDDAESVATVDTNNNVVNNGGQNSNANSNVNINQASTNTNTNNNNTVNTNTTNTATNNYQGRPHVYPYVLDKHRHLNFGFGSIVRWSIKRPVWSTIAITGGLLGVAGILSGVVPAFGALFSSIKIATISVVSVGILVGGAIQIGKQILKKTNPRYRSLFLTDKANKLNRKIADKIRRIQSNMNNQRRLLEDEVGLLHGNATKTEGRKELSENNINTIRNEHAEYLKLQKQNQKLIQSGKGITNLNNRMQRIMEEVDRLEGTIGREDSLKQRLRQDKVKDVNSIIGYVNRAHKQMGKVYRPNTNMDIPEGESNANVYDHYRRYYTDKVNQQYGTSNYRFRENQIMNMPLDSDYTQDIKSDVRNRVGRILDGESEDNFGVRFINIEGKEEYVRSNNPKYFRRNNRNNNTARENNNADANVNTNTGDGNENER